MPEDYMDKFLAHIERGSKPTEVADDLADFYASLPEMAGTDYAQRMREAKFDADRLQIIVEEATEYCLRARDAVP